jgi:hypothetical protein
MINEVTTTIDTISINLNVENKEGANIHQGRRWSYLNRRSTIRVPYLFATLCHSTLATTLLVFGILTFTYGLHFPRTKLLGSVYLIFAAINILAAGINLVQIKRQLNQEETNLSDARV